MGLAVVPAAAQEGALQPGEAYVTRFSGVVPGPGGAPTINVGGTVGSILDVRAPSQPPRGEHWMDEPQRAPVTAGEVGQVFGVVLDDETPPNVYLSATAAFGLHLAPGTQQWMPGMWGGGGGPGTVYRLDASNNYRPRPLANVTLGGRPNTGAALGNMAFDRANKQIFVTDLETGMIHRIQAASGADLGAWDHGTRGRARFVDATSKRPGNLPPIAFDPASRARVTDCGSGPFERTPACWNVAASGRRVWGVGVRRDPAGNESRLYYAVWSSPAFGQTAAWNAATDEDKRNAVWSVRLGPDGSFDGSDVRREFILPDFFVKPQDTARAGFSQPVSDITFAECGERPVMLLAERGGLRNLGLAEENAFAVPHEARALRYELDQSGAWQPVGRYDVGYYDRKKEGQPHLRANCAGGVAFGFGYNADWTEIDASKPDQFVWISGDALCSAEGPCRVPAALQTAQPAGQPGAQPVADQPPPADASEVSGIQGTPENAVDQLVPPAAFAAYPQNGEPYPAVGPDQSYLIDTDINVDPSGAPIEAEFTRNDATRIGDVAVYQTCAPPPAPPPVTLLPPLPPPPLEPVTVLPPIEGHDPALTHAAVASHGARSSHFRIASHNPWLSHDRIRSHNRWRSHNEIASAPIHRPPGSWHRPPGSFHRPPGSIHRPPGSFHRPPGSIHRPPGSIHRPPGSIHRPPGSLHRPPGSIHLPPGSIHRPPGSIHRPPGSLHRPPGSIHRPPGSLHRPPGSIHRPPGSLHRPPGSVHRPPGSIHRPPGSVHRPPGSIGPLHQPPGSRVHVPPGSRVHVPPGSRVHVPPGSRVHVPPGSRVHVPPGSAGALHQPPGSRVHRPPGSVRVHSPPGSVRVHQPPGSVRVHNPPGSVRVHRPPGSVRVHSPPGSVRVHNPPGSVRVHRPPGSVRVHNPPGSVRLHNPPGSRAVHQPPGSRRAPVCRLVNGRRVCN